GAPARGVSGWLPARRSPLPRDRARRLRPAAPRPLLARRAAHAPLLPVGRPARTDRAPARRARGSAPGPGRSRRLRRARVARRTPHHAGPGCGERRLPLHRDAVPERGRPASRREPARRGRRPGDGSRAARVAAHGARRRAGRGAAHAVARWERAPDRERGVPRPAGALARLGRPGSLTPSPRRPPANALGGTYSGRRHRAVLAGGRWRCYAWAAWGSPSVTRG